MVMLLKSPYLLRSILIYLLMKWHSIQNLPLKAPEKKKIAGAWGMGGETEKEQKAECYGI